MNYEYGKRIVKVGYIFYNSRICIICQSLKGVAATQHDIDTIIKDKF